MFSKNLRVLSNERLHAVLTALAAEERKLTLEILHHLREVERRSLFAERGHSSLFEYVTKELLYSEASAQRRISAMRALKELPELETKVESGELKLTQIAQVQSFLKSEKNAGKPYSIEAKRELFQETIGRSTRETERLLAEKSPSFGQKERVRLVTESLTQITFTADRALVEKLEKVKNRFAHRLPAGASMKDVITYLADVVLEKEDRKVSKDTLTSKDASLSETVSPSKNVTPSSADVLSGSTLNDAPLPAREVDIASVGRKDAMGDATSKTDTHPESRSEKSDHSQQSQSRYLPAAVKREVWQRDQGRCTFVSPTTGKRCQSEHRLEVDHIHPFALGGTSREAENLRLLCFAHNQFEARRRFGEQRFASRKSTERRFSDRGAAS
jgi:hypothetical protein